MNIDDFDYQLPKELIAQEPMNPRERANLMVVHRDSGKIEHKKIADFPSLLTTGDVLVINNTKVFRARMNVTLKRNGLPYRTAELFLVRPLHSKSVKALTLLEWSEWQAIGRPGKTFSVGARIMCGDGFEGEVVEHHDDGTFIVKFSYPVDEVMQKANRVGTVPIPPYIKKIADPNDYQTAYAKVTGSVAAPTAGFHLTSSLLQQIKNKGVTILELTLHVGLGTFLPVKTTTVEEHTMHSEWVEITQETATIINQAKKDNRRIIAIGTTTTRALEGVAKVYAEQKAVDSKVIDSYQGDVNVFITPGFQFRVIDGLLTNFHLPKSTLLLLVSAFAGKTHIKDAYTQAVEKKYRFYSFGDAMIII